MVRISKTLVGGLVCAIAIGTATWGVHAAEVGAPHVFKAARGVSMELGSKKIAGYYVSNDGVCDVTLMVGDLPDADGYVSASVTRINLPVKAGANARVYTSEGKALAVSCSIGTKMMTLRTLDQTASAAK